MKTYFTCAVFSGSTCMCGSFQEISRECGHKHRTEETANKCLNKLQGWSKDGQSCSANWYHGKVIERDILTNTRVYILPVYDEEYNYLHDKITNEYDNCTCN